MDYGYQLSPVQRRLLAQGSPGAAAFGTVIELETALDAGAIAAALERVCARHEILGSSFARASAGTPPVQVPASLPELVDRRTAPHAPWPAGSAALTRVAAAPGGVVVSFSPLAADAGTVPLILRELSAELAGSARPEPGEYSMMAQWLNELGQAPEGAAGRAYWQDVLAEDSEEWRDAAAAPALAEASWPVPAPAADLDSVREVAGDAGLAALLAALWARQVRALRDAGRCLIGVYLDGRLEEDVLDLMGPLGRYAPVWCDAGETAATVRLAMDRAAENAEMLSLDQAWRFRYAFDYLDLRAHETGARPVRVRSRSEHVGVRLSAVELPDGTAIEVRAAPGNLDEVSGRLLADRVGYALSALARRDAGAQLVTPGEAELLASLGRPAQAARGPAGPVTALVRAHASERPDAIAVCGPEGEVTYAGLEQAVRRAGRELAGRGVTAGSRVLIGLPRGLGLIATLLATWRSGATAVPVDPDIPAGRLAEIIEDCEPVTVIGKAPQDDGRGGSPQPPPEAAGGGAAAYIIYTSGSTGRPKGVQVGQAALAAHCAAILARLGITAQDRAALLASPGFDVAIEQICVTLIAGAALCVLPRPLAAADELARFAAAQRVSVLNVSPSLWQVLAEQWASRGRGPGSVRQLILGAERVGREHIEAARRLLPGATIWNAYGPAESVITATLHRIASPEDAGVIGRPVGGRVATVRDRQGRLTPLGGEGELWLSGACLADGYFQDPGLTSRRFPVDADGVRWLRTGDVVTMRADGALRFLGRRDRQVKVRGQRVELDEVESRCQELPGVHAAAVCVAVRDGGAAADLVAFVESAADAAQQELWPGLLSGLLPRYMRPARVVALGRLPRLASGKIDYSALAEEAARAPSAAAEPPATPWERTVARLWAEALRLPVIARDSDFFELGGHSLAAVRIVTRLRETSHPELRATDLFEHHTVRRFAELLEAAALPEPAAQARPGSPPLEPAERTGPGYAYRPSHAQRRLWFISRFIADDTSYHAPLALRTGQHLEWDAFQAAWSRLAGRHEALRTTFAAPGGVLEARVSPASRLELRLADLREHADVAARLADEAGADLAKPFDLENGPTGRVMLALLPGGASEVHVTLHHIVTDLWSTAILLRDLIAELGTSPPDRASPGNAPPARQFQYSDYAAWEQRQAGSPAWAEHERYLLSQLTPPPAPLELPADFPRPEVQSYAGDEFDLELGPGTGSRTREFAAARGLTPFMVLMAAYLITLRRLTGADDLTVGMPIAGREQAQFQNVVGFFVATAFVRVDMSAARTPAQLLEEVRRQCHQAYRCQDYPFDLLISRASLERPVDRTPVFSTMAAYQDLPPLPEWAARGPGAWQLMPLPATTSKFDLDLTFWPEDGELKCSVTYSTALFRRQTATAFAALFGQCLNRLLEAG